MLPMEPAQELLGLFCGQIPASHLHRAAHQMQTNRCHINQPLNRPDAHRNSLDMASESDRGATAYPAPVLYYVGRGQFECLARRIHRRNPSRSLRTSVLRPIRSIRINGVPHEYFAQFHGGLFVANGQDSHTIVTLAIASNRNLHSPPTEWSPQSGFANNDSVSPVNLKSLTLQIR